MKPEQNKLLNPPIITRIDLTNCPLCNMAHFGQELSKLGMKIDNFTHSITCPFKNELIYLTINFHPSLKEVAWHECVPNKENCTICGD